MSSSLFKLFPPLSARRLLGGAFLASLVACEPGPPQGEPVDDPATPGDDRPGYFVCRKYGSLNTVLCAPEQVCCVVDEPTCVSADPGCPSPFEVVSCDGPEDCDYEGEHC